MVKKRKVSRAALRREAKERVALFLAIGEFIYEFSQLEFTIRHLLGSVLEINDERRFNLVVSPYDFATLCRVANGVIHEMKFFDEKRLKEIEDIFKKCLKVNDERVRIAHGSWFLGSGARHVSRQSFKPTFHFENPADIIKQTRLAKDCMNQIIYILIGEPDEWPAISKRLMARDSQP